MYTIFGSNGFIGRKIIEMLDKYGEKYYLPEKNQMNIKKKNLGKVIYCAGVTTNVVEKSIETVEAHVSYLLYILKNYEFDSFVYLSSTRVYKNNKQANESMKIEVNPNDADQIYNISKIMGEVICNYCGKENIKVARLSNVVGFSQNPKNFLDDIITSAIKKKEITLRSTMNSEKDYIYVQDVINILMKMCNTKGSGIYNIASGINITNKEIIEMIKKEIKFEFKIEKNAQEIKFPTIDNEKIIRELNFQFTDIYKVISQVICDYKNDYNLNNKH